MICCAFLFAAILNELLQRENRVLHFWTLKKRRLDQCQQYLVFERSTKQVWSSGSEYIWSRKTQGKKINFICWFCLFVQALDWIQETGDVYLATHTSPGESNEETQELLNDYQHFRHSAKVRSVYHIKRN